MATRVLVILEDDLDRSEAFHTVRFAVAGREHEIDLNDQHEAQLRQTFAHWIKYAHPTRCRATAKPIHGVPVRASRAQLQKNARLGQQPRVHRQHVRQNPSRGTERLPPGPLTNLAIHPGRPLQQTLRTIRATVEVYRTTEGRIRVIRPWVASTVSFTWLYPVGP